MIEEHLKFYGSREDLDALRQALENAGFPEYHDGVVRASHDVIPPSLTVLAALGIYKCIKAYLITCGKRMVTYENFGKKVTIKGNFSVRQIEKLTKIPHSLKIKDDVTSGARKKPAHRAGKKRIKKKSDRLGRPASGASILNGCAPREPK